MFRTPWKRIREAVLGSPAAGASAQAANDQWRQKAQSQAPIIWMLGKTGAGKSSIIQALTGADRALIGNGFEPCTRSSNVFDFPAEVPLVRFLDTRGLGESGYDAAEDIAVCESRSHLIIVVVRVKDPDQSIIVQTVRKARQRHPDWPIIVAQSTLHGCYRSGDGHLLPYPFTGLDKDFFEQRLPSDLRSCLAYQRDLFKALPGKGPLLFVPLDLTQADDGYTPVDYGIEALRQAIETTLPDALSAILERDHSGKTDRIAERARSLILGYSLAAMGSGAIPVPFVDAAAITAVIGMLLRTLASRYDTEWDARTLREFSACLGTGVVLNQMATYSVREVAKLIPFWGQTAGLAMSGVAAFALCYAMGRAACVYLGQRQRGDSATKTDVQNAFKSALRHGFEEAARIGRSKSARSA